MTESKSAWSEGAYVERHVMMKAHNEALTAAEQRGWERGMRE